MKAILLALLASTAMLTLTGCVLEEHRHVRHYGYDNGYYDRGYSRYDDGYYGGYPRRSATVIVEPRASVYRRDVYVASPDVRRSTHASVRSSAPVYRQPSASATVVVTDKKKKKHHDHD